jgi:hypothetical protein
MNAIQTDENHLNRKFSSNDDNKVEEKNFIFPSFLLVNIGKIPVSLS